MIIKGYALILMGAYFHFLIDAKTDQEFTRVSLFIIPLLPVFGRVFDLW